MSKKTTTKKSSKATRPLPENECLCGCGEKCRNHFKQGHDARVAGWLGTIGAGERPEGVHHAVIDRILRLVADKHPAFTTPHMRTVAKAALAASKSKRAA